MSFNLKRVLFGKFCSLFAASLFTFVAGLTVLRETSSGFQFALVLLAGSVPRILLSPIAGVLADRWNRKRIIVTTESLSALVLFGLLLYSLQAPLHTVHYIVASVLLTSLSTFLSVTLSSSLPRLVQEKELQRGNALFSTIQSTSTITAPLVAGLLIAAVSITQFLVLPFLLFASAAWWNSRLRFHAVDTSSSPDNGDTPSFVTEFKEGYRYLFRQPVLTTLVLMAIVLNFFFVAFEILLPIILLDRLQFTPFRFGLVESALGAGLLVASLLLALPRFTVKRPLRTIFESLFLLASCYALPALALLGYVPSALLLPFFMVLLFLDGMLVLRMNIPLQLIVQKQTDPAYLGRVIGVLESVAMAMMPIGTLLFGLLSDHVSIIVLLGVGTVGLFSAALFGFLRLRKDILSESVPVADAKNTSSLTS
ncbi:MFS transporter [Exiguobacterium acetylicum]|uniref:MFS transporter n=1 Tax=Exiguobacterium acetylicum TaxID=41170 RepID=UPI001EE360B2|nr:MFS transporter [Exiguobacterium acetylicum]UKS57108.1 MFS transporter [Exiguobacterium acetylicum]